VEIFLQNPKGLALTAAFGAPTTFALLFALRNENLRILG